MRSFVNFFKKIFKIPKQKKERKSNEDRIDDPIDLIVKKYIENDYIDIPLLPNFLEKKIYKQIFLQLLDIFNEKIEEFQVKIFHHKITANFKPYILNSLVENPTPSKINDSLYKDNEYIVELVKIFVDSNQVNSLGIPKSIQFSLYKNILVLLLAVINDALKCTNIKVLGQRIKLVIEKLDIHEIPTKDSLNKETVVKSLKDQEETIEKMVENIMEKNNIFLVPDFIERHLYKTSFSIVFFFLSQIINDMKIYFLHHLLDVQMQPSKTL